MFIGAAQHEDSPRRLRDADDKPRSRPPDRATTLRHDFSNTGKEWAPSHNLSLTNEFVPGEEAHGDKKQEPFAKEMF